MTITLDYDDTLGRVRITANALGTDADEALIERSTDQIRWTTVRGAGAVPVSGGVMSLTIDDYEFSPDVVNYYRVSGVDTANSSNIGSGAAAVGNNASVVPALPGSLVTGATLLLLATIRNSGTGTVNDVANWTRLIDFGNIALFGKRWVSGDAAPTVSFSGGVANATTIAQIYARANLELIPVTYDTMLNASAQNIAYPALTITQDHLVILIAGWKQDDWTSVATLAGFTEISETSSTTGDDAGIVWDRVLQTTATDVPAGSFVVTGGASAISRSFTAAFRRADYITRQTATIIPALAGECGSNGVWLKSIARPFLNRKVRVIFPPDTQSTRPARAGIFDVVGRTLPVAVNTVRGSKRWTMLVRTFTAAEAEELDLMLASGDTLLVQGPADCVLDTGYVTVGDATNTRHPLRPLKRLWELPMVEVAQPGPDVVGALGTWQTVLNTYATWEDVIAANATWADLLTLVGDPSEVIVP